MRPPWLVVGVGSPHGDDQVGWRLADQLARGPSARIEAVAVKVPIDLIECLEGREALVVIDAARTGRSPCEITRLDWPEDRLETTCDRSTHGFGVAGALALAETLGRLPPKVVLLAVEVEDARGSGGLSPELQHGLPELGRRIEALIRLECAIRPEASWGSSR